jgi:predicted amidohydrolase
MKIGFFQYNVIWRNRDANLSYIREKIKGSTFDLLVLPEFFTSGYAFDSKDELIPFSENLKDSYTVKYLSELMKDYGGYITGTIPELCGNLLCNTSILVGVKGLVAYYRKIHLPDYEKRAFAAGNKAVSSDCGGAKVGLTICFDAWFAPLSSKLKLQGVDIICHSACFGGEITPTIIPIRALENQSFYVSCNRIGTELFNGEPDSYRGESQIVSPDGKILAEAGREESLTIIDVDLSEVNKPAFGSLITKDFLSEHKKYNIMTNSNT